MKKLNKKQKTLLFIICIIAIVVISGILAYLTDTEEKVNTFVIGKVDIELTEPKWDEALNITKQSDNNATIPAAAQKVVPNRKIDKDPTVTNVGPTEAFVYVKVTVPKATFALDHDYDNTTNSIIEDEGNEAKYTTKAQPLFTYEVDPTKWTEIYQDNNGKAILGTNADDRKYAACYEETTDAYIHVYFYTDNTTGNKLPSEASTGSIFIGDYVRFANVKVEDYEDVNKPVINSNQTITVDAYAIQTTGYEAVDGKPLVLCSEWANCGFKADGTGKPVTN